MRRLEKEKPLVRTIEVISYLLILLPVALAFLFVYLYGVNVVFWDQWATVDRLDGLFSGKLSLWDLFWSSFGGQNPKLHNTFFPRTTMLLLAVATKYNNLVEMYLILTCFLVTLVCLLLVFRDTIRSRLSFFSPILFLPVPFLVFSLRQHENMLWGFQLTVVFAQVFSVLAFYFLHVSGRTRFRKAGFLAAVGSGTVASFSAVPGMFVWPAGLLQLLVAPAQKSTKMLRLGVWGLAGAAEWFVFFFNFASPNDQGLQDVLNRPTREIASFLFLLGRSLFGGQEGLALASGILLAGLVAAIPLLVYKGRDPGGYSFWLALLLFSFLTLAAIVAGRGAAPTLNSRYVSFSVLAVIGVYVVLVKFVLDRRSYVVGGLLGVLSTVIVLSIPGSYSEGLLVARETGGAEVEFKKTVLYRERAAFILATYESQPEEFLGALNPKPGRIGSLASTLESLGYNVFSEPRPRVLPPPLSTLSPIPSPTLSKVESVSGIEVDPENQPISIPTEESFIEVTGWAVDAEAEEAAGGVYVDIDGEPFPAFYGTDKNGSDTKALADDFDIPSYGHAVFERAIPVSDIGTGTHELSIVALSNDKERYYQPDRKVAFEVTAP